MKKQIIFWCVMIFFSLGIMEIAFSVYYFQRTHAAPFAIVQLWHSVKERIDQSGILGQPERNRMYVNDDRFGFSLKKNSKPVRDNWCNKITYTIDSNKERFIPDPEISAGYIAFLGGSFTFGYCVNDSESYPYILATEYWKNWKIRNTAVIAWGTSQAYLKLSDLIESNPPPSMIIYGMISHHIRRNYLSRKWIQPLAKYGWKLPHFELVNGDLVFQGVVGLSASIKNERELRNKELELTSAFLSSMQKKCAERDIPFIVVLLPSSYGETYPPSVIYTMYKSNIPVLDLTKLQYERIKSDPNKHPNPMDNRRIAAAIANSFVSDILVNLENSIK